MPVASRQRVAGLILTATAPLEVCVAVAEPVPVPVLLGTAAVDVTNAVAA
jgi:hypothetical protein